MTLNFPAAPADGDIYLNYVYDATEGVWNANPRQLASRFVTSATTPAEPSNGDGWFNTTNGKTYIFYYDGTSGQWIESGYPVLGYQTLSNLSDTTIATPTTGQVLKYDGTDWVNGTDNVGKILQVVSTVKTDANFSTSSPSFVTVTGLTASITPTSASSKILVMAQVSYGGGADARPRFRLSGGNSANYVGDAAGSRIRTVFGGYHDALNSDLLYLHPGSIVYLDSPATTSATTYEVQATTNLGTIYVNRSSTDSDNASSSRGASSITLMEVAG
jgi:hypothetical protein